MRSSDDLSFYYAHLDRQTVGTGARVRAGEKLGEVGNTGNARSTPPHLHFAVFRGGEAVDPWGYLVDLGAGKPAVEAPTERLGDWIRTATAGLRLRGGPGTSFSVLDELPGQYPLRVDAAVRNWFRVETAAGRAGFVAAWLTAELDPPLARRVIAEPLEVLAEPSPGAPEIARFSEGVSLSIQARAGALDLVLGPENVRGWVRAR
jgi:murein DD-endopeptidase MepM/ murein hydrolase activator NlpD